MKLRTRADRLLEAMTVVAFETDNPEENYPKALELEPMFRSARAKSEANANRRRKKLSDEQWLTVKKEMGAAIKDGAKLHTAARLASDKGLRALKQRDRTGFNVSTRTLENWYKEDKTEQ